ncbi:MarR family winged helix-turn-helix transcriptional regulator [Arthrobacter sp. E3]|uniref:MarR family winged helix-turn-helix transcriptional regulator n=1 Tax=Arthrobacter sp. E3 TaxID=517402 RepID=UPI001A951EE8|nr:MarR family winged helix-turn-helix transcriptional regulator [Arthrobacter sp. E3]
MGTVLHETNVLGQLEYELMLLARYALRPQHRQDEVLDRSAMVLLSRLENVPPMTLKELSCALRLDGSTVHRQSAALLRAGLLDYAPRDGGEVARRVMPTLAGTAALANTRSIYEQGLEGVVRDWPAERRSQLVGMLQAFNKEVERLEGALWPRSEETAG